MSVLLQRNWKKFQIEVDVLKKFVLTQKRQTRFRSCVCLITSLNIIFICFVSFSVYVWHNFRNNMNMDKKT